MKQQCGHDESSVRPTRDGAGTWCCECLPDDSLTTYVVQNVKAFATMHGCYVVASVPPGLGGRVACTPFAELAEAEQFAGGLTGPAWVIADDGELVATSNVKAEDLP